MGVVLRVLADTLRAVATLLQPFMPGSMARMLDQLGVPADARRFAALAHAAARTARHCRRRKACSRATWKTRRNHPPMLIDSHCHLDYYTADELPGVMQRAAEAGVHEMVTIGTTLAQAPVAIALADAHDNVWCTVGVHPHHAAEAPVPHPSDARALTQHPKVIGIGESGLDYFYDRSPRDVQQANFRANIRAARLSGLPLAIHARDADDDIARILQEERDAGGDFDFLLHCFSSSRRLAEVAIRMGGYVSFSGILTFPKSNELRDDRARSSGRAPAGRDRRALSRPGAGARQAERAGQCAPHRVGAGGASRCHARRLGRPHHRQFPAPVSESRLMRVVLLGCGASAGVPMIGGADGGGDWGQCDPAEPRNRRTRSSIIIESAAGQRLLVDTGPDLRTQLLACRIPRVDAILYTHAHADHITGLDDVRILNRIAGRPLDAFATRRTLDELQARFAYAFRPWKPPGFFRPVLEVREIEAGQTITAADMAVRLIHQDHGFGPTLGLRTGGFAYSTDVVRLDDAALAELEGVDTWVVGCFGRTPHPTHAHVDLVLAWAERVGARRTVLTHMGTDLDWDWLMARLPPGVEPGYDGMELSVLPAAA